MWISDNGRLVTPALSDYMDLIRRFLNEIIPLEEFERVYLQMYKDDPTIRPSAEYNVLNVLFFDIDAFCADPELRSTNDLDEASLRIRARHALSQLEEISLGK
jgi:Bacterial self-protective colicin-like immunity